MGEIIFITGTDTGVGKTVLTALLLQHLRGKKIHALAMKPFCSGDRADVKILQKLQPGELSDFEVNPYFFPKPIAPFVAAKKLGKKIKLNDVIEKIRKLQNRCDVLLVEGIGGLMVPLGKNFCVRDLIVRLKAKLIVVSRNKLGTINHTMLTATALQIADYNEFTVVLMEPGKRDGSFNSNQEIIRNLLKPTRCFSVPFMGGNCNILKKIKESGKKNKKMLAAILKCV